MRKQFLFAACTLFAASALLMTSCQQAEEPIANDPTDQAGPAGKNPGDGEVKQKRSTAVAGLSYRPG